MIAQKPGTVYLIGAGPGDPGLVTVRAKELLERVDAVVFDHLVPDELVVMLGDDVEKIYVGKQSGHHAMPQEQINALLVSLAKTGKTVGRLKGGDPFVFGRGGEEARFLKENGVPFEIVPGVTSGVAAPECCGIPVTDRDRASFVIFATGHKAKEKDKTGVPWEWMAKARQGTIVIYMGVSEMPRIVETLIDNGMSPETPAAAIERGTLPTQRFIHAKLKDLPGVAERENLQPPALICVGQVIDLQAEINWCGNRPLFGLRVMVTRPADQSAELYLRLRELGAEVLPYQTIATRPARDDVGWEEVRGIKAANKWLIFTSENAVRYFMRQHVEHMGDLRLLGGFKVGAVGSGTARALEEYSLRADFVPTTGTTAQLATQMKDSLDLNGASVVRVQGNLSDDTVADILSSAGATVIPLTVYNTYKPKWPEGFKDRLLARPPDVILFSSGSTADGLREHLSEDELRQVTERAVIVSIGPMTSRHVAAQGMKVTIQSKVHSIPSMVDELLAYCADNLPRRS